jgi:hypothetical protein
MTNQSLTSFAKPGLTHFLRGNPSKYRQADMRTCGQDFSQGIQVKTFSPPFVVN